MTISTSMKDAWRHGDINYYAVTRTKNTRELPLWSFVNFLFFSCRYLLLSSRVLLSFPRVSTLVCRRSTSSLCAAFSLSSFPQRPAISWTWHSWSTNSHKPSPACCNLWACAAACLASSYHKELVMTTNYLTQDKYSISRYLQSKNSDFPRFLLHRNLPLLSTALDFLAASHVPADRRPGWYWWYSPDPPSAHLQNKKGIQKRRSDKLASSSLWWHALTNSSRRSLLHLDFLLHLQEPPLTCPLEHPWLLAQPGRT